MESFKKYRLDSKEEKDLFKKAIIIFDTSSILDFYYYSEHTREEIFKTVFSKIKNRLWIPFQVSFEFMKNREKVMTKPIDSYKNLITKHSGNKDNGHFDEIISIVRKFQKEEVSFAKGQLKTLIEKTQKNDKHPFFEENYFNDLEKRIDLLDNYLTTADKELKKFREKLEKDIEQKIKTIEDIKSKDSIKLNIEKYFEIGEEFDYGEQLEIVREGELRYRNQIPPGYEDFDEKLGFQKFGDLIFWKQILKYAKNKDLPFILVTNDNKNDWWHFDGKKNSNIPRYELITEFNEYNSNKFWMYNSNDFLFKIKQILKFKIDDSAIAEVKSVYKAKSHEFDDKAILDWISANYKWNWIITYDDNDKEKLKGLDYVLYDKNKEYKGFAVYKGRGSRYTSLLKPLQEALSKKDILISDHNLKHFTQIIVCKDKIIAENISAHIGRKNPSKLLKHNLNDFNVIIGYTNEEGTEFHSVSDSNEIILD